MLNILPLFLALLAPTIDAYASTKIISTAAGGKFEVIETPPANAPDQKSPLLVIAPAKEYTMTGKIFESLAERASEIGYFVVRFNWKFVTDKSKTSTDLKSEGKELGAILDHYSKSPKIDSGHVVLAAKSFGSRAAMLEGAYKKAAAIMLITPNCDKVNTFEKTYSGIFDFEGPMQIVISVTDPYCDVLQIYAAAGRFSRNVTLFTLAGDHNFVTGMSGSAMNEEAALIAMTNWLAQLR